MASSPGAQLVAQMAVVATVISLDGFGIDGDVEVPEQKLDHSGIGAAPEVEGRKFVSAMGEIKLLQQGRTQCPTSGSPGIDQGSIDVEEQQRFHGTRRWEGKEESDQRHPEFACR